MRLKKYFFGSKEADYEFFNMESISLKKNKSLSFKFKILLASFVAVSLFSFTRPFYEKEGFYFGKYIWLGALFLLLLAATAMKRKIAISRETAAIALFFGMWLLAMVGSLFFGEYPLSGGLVAASYAVLFVSSFILMPNYLADLRRAAEYKKFFFWATFFSMAAIFVLGLFDRESVYVFEDRVRYQSFFANPNFLGLFSFLGAMMSVEMAALTRRKKYFLTLALFVALIYSSDSRASMVGFGVFCAALIFISFWGMVKNGLGKYLLKIILAFIFLAFIAAVAFAILANWESLRNPEYSINKILSYRRCLLCPIGISDYRSSGG